MDIQETLESTLEAILIKLQLEFSKIEIIEEENNNFCINVSSEDASHFIGYHGDNIHAIQHILKTLCWKKCKTNQFNILLDVDEYRKRQEENVIGLAQKRIDSVRKNGRPQHLPPMSSYLRRKVHLHCMNPGNEDLETFSTDEGDRRHIVLKLKS